MTLLAFTLLLLLGDEPMTCHHEQVDARHDTLGIHHAESRHHFRLYRNGGAIELSGKDAQAIRKHLREITDDFAKGDFDTPMFVHGKMPDGTDAMKRLRAKITYRYEDVPGGGRIRVRTRDAEALEAIHAFLKFQVKEHRTGDSGEVETE